MIKLFLLLIIDIIVIAFSLILAHYFRMLLDPFFSEVHLHNLELYITFWPIYITTLFIFAIEKVYYSKYLFWQELRYIYKGLVLSFVIVLSFLAITQSMEEYSRAVFVFAYLFMFFLFPYVKIGVKYFLHSFDFMCKKVHVISENSEFKKSILQNRYLGYQESYSNFDVLIIDTSEMKSKKLDKLIQQNMHDTKEILFLPYLKDINFSHADFIEVFKDRYSLISISNVLLKPLNIYTKKFFEYFVILICSPLIIFVFVFLYSILKIFYKGDSVFFLQKRLGKKGEVFYCYKFRTMYEGSENILKEYLQKHPEEIEYYKQFKKYKKDPRVTPIGVFLRKSSLDELPQLINVLKGEMSLVGPRPYMIHEKEDFVDNADIILAVAPGITGLWQVSGRNNLSFEERINIDKYYIRNWNLWLDFVIFVKTIKTVLLKEGAR